MPTFFPSPTAFRCGLGRTLSGALIVLACAACPDAQRATQAAWDASVETDAAPDPDSDSDAAIAADGDTLAAEDAQLELDADGEQDACVEVVVDAGPDADASDAAHDAGAELPPLRLRLGAASAVTRPAQLIAAPDGDLFLVGHTNGAIATAERRGLVDALITRIAPDGTLRWVRQLGDLGVGPGLAVKAWDAALTRAGELLVTGLVNGRGTLQGQTLTTTHSGFVAAYSPTGEQRWLRLLAGSDGAAEAMAVEVLDGGEIVVVGYTTASRLLGADALGAGDVFVSWISPAGEVLRTRRYGGEHEEYPTAVSSDASGLYLGFKLAPIGQPASELRLVRLDAAGDPLASTAFEDPARTELAALATTEQGVCAALQLRVYASDTGAATDYGLRCYDRQLVQQRSLRGGSPGANTWVQGLACDRAGRCALAGNVDTRFEGEALGAGVDAFALAFAPDDTRLFARRLRGTTQEDETYTRAATIAIAGDGRFVIAGEVRHDLFGMSLGALDGFVSSLE